MMVGYIGLMGDFLRAQVLAMLERSGRTRLDIAAAGGFAATTITNYLKGRNDISFAKLLHLVRSVGGELIVIQAPAAAEELSTVADLAATAGRHATPLLRLARAMPLLDEVSMASVIAMIDAAERRSRACQDLRVVG